MEMSILCLFIIVFWKYTNCCLVPQFHSWREILPQDESYLKSHPTHTWFRWYLDEILDLELLQEWVKTFGAVKMGWIHFACKKNMIWGSQMTEYYELNLFPPKIHMLSPNTQYLRMWLCLEIGS